MQRHLLIDDPARLAALRIRLLVLLGHVDVLDDDAVVLDDTQHGSALTLVFAGEDDDVVTLV